MYRRFLASIFNIHGVFNKLCIMKIENKENAFLIIKEIKLSKIAFLGLMTATVMNVNAVSLDVPVDTENAVTVSGSADETVEDEFRNDVGVLMSEEEIKILKNSYISPYNYLQDPVALNMGFDTKTGSANGMYHGGFSAIAGGNRPINRDNMAFNTDIGEIWGQTGRL